MLNCSHKIRKSEDVSFIILQDLKTHTAIKELLVYHNISSTRRKQSNNISQRNDNDTGKPALRKFPPPNSTSMGLELNKDLCSDQATRLYE